MVIAFKAWHLAALDPLSLREDQRATATLENGLRFEESEWFTYMEAGRPIACWGFVVNEHGRWLCSYLTRQTGPRMLRLYRIGKALLAGIDGPVLSATQPDFYAGCRWLTMLGFKPVRPLSDLYPEMTNAMLYERT